MKRQGNHSHYERAFEKFLQKNKINYLPTNEVKKTHIGGKKIKGFDFMIFKNKSNRSLLFDVKGKQFPYLTNKNNLFENWIYHADIKGLKTWQNTLGFVAILGFVFLLKNRSYAKFFENTFTFEGGLYGVACLDLQSYLANMKSRSLTPRTYSVSRKVFANLAKPISYYL
jgi:hypothetical protein